jgi:uncharacterized protein (TIGR00255 family)
MTGYGRAEYKENGIELTIEIKTVNNRYLDVNCKYPRCFSALEDMIRTAVKTKLTRGRIDVFVNFTDNREKDKNLVVDTLLAKSYFEAAKKINEATGNCLSNLTLSDLIRVPDIIKLNDENDDEFLKEPVQITIDKALDSLNDMRNREGEKLKIDMLARLEGIKETLSKIEERAPLIAVTYREKLKNRIEDYLKDIKIDEARLLNEVAAYSDRSNIDEELTRLKSHISQFKKICAENNSGKKLDFLIQEFNREANTICSKSNDIDVTNYGLNLKCEIEKIREQVQNIE